MQAGVSLSEELRFVSFVKYLWSAYCVSTLLSASDVSQHTTVQFLAILRLIL